MASRASRLAAQIDQLVEAMETMVNGCSEEQWRKACAGEGWSVGVVARHFAAAHLGIRDLVQSVVEGKDLPPITREAIDQMNAEHAREHERCSRDEVLGLLAGNGPALAAYVRARSDEELDRTGTLPAAGGSISAGQFVGFVVLQSGGEHLESLRQALG